MALSHLYRPLEDLPPRYLKADAKLPGDELFWRTLVEQSDIFAYSTAKKGADGFPKGGPFGAQLWLWHEEQGPVLVGTADHPEASNAVVSKGLASAHAEAENLSPENRDKVIEFLANEKAKGRDGWKVVQVSSGESCPACRSKQVLFALELEKRGLIRRGDFHVAFKATYEQTQQVAGFNDEPYDNTFRVMDGLLQNKSMHHMSDFDKAVGKAVERDRHLNYMYHSGKIVHVPVLWGQVNEKAPRKLAQIFKTETNFGGGFVSPSAAIISRDGQRILGVGRENRVGEGNGKKSYAFESGAVVRAIHAASAELRQEGQFNSWDLNGAILLTNIFDLGPLAFSEALWSNLSAIVLLQNLADSNPGAVREFIGVTNSTLFNMVAADYNSDDSPVRVTHLGAKLDSTAHQLWQAQQSQEEILSEQALRLQELNGVRFRYIDGGEAALSEFVQHSDVPSTHYDGAQGGEKKLELPDFITLFPR
jgi:hypothetical protein